MSCKLRQSREHHNERIIPLRSKFTYQIAYDPNGNSGRFSPRRRRSSGSGPTAEHHQAQLHRRLASCAAAVLTHPILVEGVIPLFSSAASAHKVVEMRRAQVSPS